jgi:enoyl-CoA hydratase/carnithine racemase
VWPYLLGARRAKYFLLTGQEIDAQEALRLGVVNEVLPPSELLARAWELAAEWAAKPLALLRYTKEAINVVERNLEKPVPCLLTGLWLDRVFAWLN